MAESSRPNILLLFPDQWRGDWIGCAGMRALKTPTLDALAANGTRFTRCATPSPLCAPARASLAMGCTYGESGVGNNGANLPLDRPTFYQQLRASGYSVGGVGKFDLAKALHNHGGDGKRLLSEWGFTHGCDSEGKWEGVRQMKQSPLTGPYGRFLEGLGLRENYVADMLRRQAGGQYTDTNPSPLPPHAYGDNWVTENAIQCIKSFPTSQPWFLQVNFPGPHEPMDWPAWAATQIADSELPPVEGVVQIDLAAHRKIQRAYASMLENIDSLCGAILQTLEETGQRDNTLILFSSDHGEMLGDHGRWGKSTWQDASVIVPLIIAGARVASGKVSNAMIQLQDLAPTILELAMADPLHSSAKSFAHLLSDPEGEHRSELRSSLGKWTRVITDAGSTLIHHDS